MIDSISSYIYNNSNYTSPTKSTVHKRNELKQLYNAIIHSNRTSPLYIVNLSEENENYALSLKESSNDLADFISSIYKEGLPSNFNISTSTSSDSSAVATQIVNAEDLDLPPEFNITVNQLASPQKNTGKYLYADAKGPKEGFYSFSVEMEDNIYEFQFNVSKNTSNLDTQNKLSNFINKTDIGLKSTVIVDETNNKSCLILTSKQTGDSFGSIFTMKDTASPTGFGIIEYFGIEDISEFPKNAEFLVNEQEKTSLSNTFLYHKNVMLTLKKADTTNPISIGYAPDTDGILSFTNNFITMYNQLVNTSSYYRQSQRKANQLTNELNHFTKNYKDELESCGITLEEDGTLSLEPYLSIQAANDGTLEDFFTDKNGFVAQLSNKAKVISLNPMEYVDKILVTYPNTQKLRFPNPYMTSIYSGMLFSRCC